ncbi:MAG: hypothetical protein LLF89_07635 [Spirochaetaceae bacterium]|nr:hypothetical protein [Spirochaetaceae bacterium]
MTRATTIFMSIMSCLFFFTGAVASAQNSFGNSSVTLKIVGTIPTVLDVKVGTSRTNTLKLVGLLDSTESLTDSTLPSLRVFLLDPSKRIELGDLRVFANVNGNYCIKAKSSNGGVLQSYDRSQPGSIPYRLVINGRLVRCENEEFRYETFGKSRQGGTVFTIALEVSLLQDGLSRGKYSDQLVFSISSY